MVGGLYATKARRRRMGGFGARRLPEQKAGSVQRGPLEEDAMLRGRGEEDPKATGQRPERMRFLAAGFPGASPSKRRRGPLRRCCVARSWRRGPKGDRATARAQEVFGGGLARRLPEQKAGSAPRGPGEEDAAPRGP